MSTRLLDRLVGKGEITMEGMPNTKVSYDLRVEQELIDTMPGSPPLAGFKSIAGPVVCADPLAIARMGLKPGGALPVLLLEDGRRLRVILAPKGYPSGWAQATGDFF